MISWTPFAAVPGVLALVTAWQSRAVLRTNLKGALVRLAPALLLFVWCFAMFTAGELITAGTSGSAALGDSITVVTLYANPAWMPLFVSALLVGGVCAVALRSRLGETATVIGATTVGLVLGAAPIFAARGSLAGVLEYYPARYVNMATAGLMPVLIAALAATLFEPSLWRRVAAVSAATVLAALVLVAPTSGELPKWGAVPVDIVTGGVFGRHDQLGDKVLDYASDTDYLVAWHADPPFDYFANWILAVNNWDPNLELPDDGQMIMRTYDRTQPASQACALAEASSRRVVLMTRDPDAAAEIAEACPDSGIVVKNLSR
jgi:hypothetical protein